MRTGAYTNTIKSSWRHVKAFLNPYNWMGINTYHMAHYKFPAGCRTANADEFTQYIGIVASMDWSAKYTLDYSNVAR
jgi:hypothetical protein